ncbi:NADH-quinone oxidoreductase subunit M [Oscillatoria laete-virens NRMC-F 0139]|nr:NADH-quinone oxidoreductase subunit M [Oscillatoria laete-virens]MDL5054724.1 NADH-quinone oxidoreductase subunit M [Oscillatoria laete-virens NRMC-F 0139]
MISATIFLPVLVGLLVTAFGKRFSRFSDGVLLSVSGGASVALTACLLERRAQRGRECLCREPAVDRGFWPELLRGDHAAEFRFSAAQCRADARDRLDDPATQRGSSDAWRAVARRAGFDQWRFCDAESARLVFLLGIDPVPVFFLIKEFGAEQRSYAAYKFFLYTLLGSLPMLLAFLFIYRQFGTLELAPSPFAAGGLMALDQPGKPAEFLDAAHWVFLGILLGVAVKLPLYPLHSWQPDAYTQAPTAVSMFLTGVMSKMGVYGLLLLLTLLPVTFQAHAQVVVWLAALTMVASITVAILKSDLKETIAYSSLNHVAICALGVAALALLGGTAPLSATEPLRTGVFFQVFSHGLSGALLFFLAGVFEKRLGTRQIGSMRGLRHSMPVFAGLLGVAAFATVGLPGLSGFIGEFLIFKGGFLVAPGGTALAFLGLIPMTMVMLKIMHHLLNGPGGGESGPAPSDMNRAERVAAMPLALIIILAGLWPKIILWIWNW